MGTEKLLMSWKGGEARVASSQEKEAPNWLFAVQHLLTFLGGLVEQGRDFLHLGPQPRGLNNQGSIRASCSILHGHQGGRTLPLGLAWDLPT